MKASELKRLRGRGHKLKPVVLVGKDGITSQVLEAVDYQLGAHELIKVKLLPACDVDKNDAADALAKKTQSQMVQRIGKTVLLYRPQPDDKDSKK